MQLILVFLGGGIGAVCRWLLGYGLTHMGWHMPYSTVLINILGSLCIGLLMGKLAPVTTPSSVYFLAVVGFCGGFTTFSTFAWENLQLLQTGRWWMLMQNMVLSTVGTLAAVWAGYKWMV